MKTTTNKSISGEQLKALHATFRAHGMDDDARHSCIYAFTEGRTESSKELTFEEARQLLTKLNPKNTMENDKVKEMLRNESITVVKSIYHLSMKISFLNKEFAGSVSEEDKQMNIAKLNRWARTYSKSHKDIKKMTIGELRDLKKQLEAIAHKEDNE
jgi:hypothetical protein